MSHTDDRLFDLLDQWAHSHRQGKVVPVEELCRDCPELVQELQRRIAVLKATDWLDKPFDDVRDAEKDKTTPADFDLPDHLGRYRLDQLIGAGGFGQVWRGFDPELRRSVAIKISRPDRISTPDRIEHFLQEARRVAQLKHPGIVPIHDVGRDERLCFIVSDLIEGKNLAEIIARNRPNQHDVARLLAEVADSLEYAHQQGFVHRDVKPSNILLGEDGRVFLTDFGIAATVDELAGENRQSVGTLAYMSPEQLRGESLDRRTDIYSLGVVLYELLAGEPPFRANNPAELRQQILASQGAPARQINGSVSPELDAICIKAMAAERVQRHQSAAELASNLRQAVGPKRGSVWPIFAGVALLTVLLSGLGWWLVKQETEAAKKEASPTIEQGQAVMDEGMAELGKTLPPLAIEKPEKTALQQRPFDLSLTKTGFDLSGQELSNDDYGRLGKHASLLSLSLADTKTTDSQLAALRSALSLRTLDLSGTLVTEEGLRHIANLPSLQRLTLDRTSLTDNGMAPICKMRLRQLSLAETGITDSGIERLVDQYGVGGHLRELDVSNTSITDASIESLKNVRRLQRLRLHGTAITDQGIEDLKTALPNCEVSR
jgi:serine/threonine protein kinase